MLFEQIVPIHSDVCIRVSELRENSYDSCEAMEEYLNRYRELVDLLKEAPRLSLIKQPLFTWHDRNSSSWRFEEQRILHEYHKLLMCKAKEHYMNSDFKGAKKLLEKALHCCKTMLNSSWIKTPYVRGMPELQLEYILALLFRTKATYCFNLHMYKSTPAVAKMAYKYVELANCLWKKTKDVQYENKLKAHYHHAVASLEASKIANEEEFDFKKLISHSTAAVAIYDDPKMLDDHNAWCERNSTVHYEEIEQVHVELFTIEGALEKV